MRSIAVQMERLAFWYLRQRGIVALPRGWRGLAVGGQAVAVCDDYDDAKPNRFVVWLEPHCHLVAVNHSIIECSKSTAKRMDR